MTIVQLTIPGEPVAWQRARAANGHVYSPKSNRQFAERVQAAWMGEGRPELGTSPLALRATFRFPRKPSHLKKNGEPRSGAPKFPPRCDLDNLLKGCLDPLNGLMFHDDSQVVSVAMSKTYSDEGSITLHFMAYDE